MIDNNEKNSGGNPGIRWDENLSQKLKAVILDGCSLGPDDK